jgi:excisionase family DNA binding protein
VAPENLGAVPLNENLKPTVVESPLLTVPQAAQFLNTTRSVIYTLARTGAVRFLRLGKRHLINRGDLQAYIEKKP